MNHQAMLCQQYLQKIYNKSQPVPLPRLNHVAETYGELLFPSIDKLLRIIPISKQDIFVDYGSGLGKLAAQVFLQTEAQAVYGIEILPALHQMALQCAEQIRQELSEFFYPDRLLEFICGDFLSLSFPQATIALVSSPCFSLSMLHALADHFNKMPNLVCVLSLRPLANLTQLHFKKAVSVQANWDSTLCYVYSKN